ncbi:unnamed protein product [Mycena citricolor]|uniref:Uncharacterized protein n=1 Tax=Mycena citricolor TaxID=2018698 RepID=A0AAD2GW08_9AGAR|nr:unnamed protein product [Mycena citricolor]CAK5277859.1 unnamed protein product [Mycena citricolor]
MKSTAILQLAFAAVSYVAAAPVRRGVDPSLVPEFGIAPGTNPTGTGDCEGNKGVAIPCTCPPDRDSFIAALSANVAFGHDVNNTVVPAPFPTDNSIQSQVTRIQTAITTLQNLHGPGVGCPAAATTFLAQIAALQAQPEISSTPAAAAATSSAAGAAGAAVGADPAGAGVITASATSASQAPNPTANSVAPTFDVSLVPEFGVIAGSQPDGTGNCKGANGVLIPCSCPPDRAAFIDSLSGNVAAGHDINNPGVGAAFPTDNSLASQITRFQTVISSMQNLHGAGVGCPAAATTWSSQLAALIAQQASEPGK